jgi:hypothetical protein
MMLAAAGFLVAVAGAPRPAAALTGRWSCLGSTSFGVIFTKGGPVFPEVLTELITLNFSTPGTPLGNLVVGYIGEVCNFPLTAVTSTSNAIGQGTLTLTFNPNIPDVDRDSNYNCGSAIYGRTTTITQRYLISSFNGGKGFFFNGNDEFITPGSADNADFFTPSGQCIQQ